MQEREFLDGHVFTVKHEACDEHSEVLVPESVRLSHKLRPPAALFL